MVAGVRWGRIFEWLRWQRETYVDAASPASAFWRDMFSDIPGNRAVALRECAGVELSGVVRVHRFGIGVTRVDVGRACRRRRVTSFMIWLAAVAAAIAESAGRDDINMWVTVPGRLARHQGVFGFLADRLPVRFLGDGLGDAAVALEVVRKVWPRVLGHQTAPCDFVLDHACGRERVVSPGRRW